VGAALTGVGLTGVALADTSAPISEGDQIQPISINAFDDNSPESTDSPNQSVDDSPAPAPAPQPGGGDDSASPGGGGGGGGGEDSASAASVDSFF
jgi:hypothetical protein